MKIRLPKDLRKFIFDGVCPVDLTGFDVDLLLPALFYRVVTLGKIRARRINDAENIDYYVQQLAMHPDIHGFTGPADVRLLRRLVKSTLIEVGRVGRSNTREQIQGLKSHTILTFKPGFPNESTRIRRVDALLYRMLLDRFSSETELRNFFLAIFGRGTLLEVHSEPSGRYDGESTLDSITRLSLALIDTFESAGVRNTRERQFKDALPQIGQSMSQDLLRFMQTYRTRMPVESFAHHLKQLIKFELFVYTNKLFHAVVDLNFDSNTLPAAMRTSAAESGPDLYLDFLPNGQGLSREMARYCVRRDLEQIHSFIPANIRLLLLDKYFQRAPDKRLGEVMSMVLAREGSGPDYLRSLLLASRNQDLEMLIYSRAMNDEDRIRQENLEDLFQNEPESLEGALARITSASDNALERVVDLISDTIGSKTASNITQWYRSVGGLSDSSGILTGTPNVRQSWRYAPSSDLLGTLVQLAAVDYVGWSFENPEPRPVSLQDFLVWLNKRFGILVDRPPEGLYGAEYSAAAKENLHWMLRRLKQMGIFRDLSDDFTVQRLTPPYMNARTEPVQQ